MDRNYHGREDYFLIFVFECAVLWCNIALCYSLLFGYIKHELNKYFRFEKIVWLVWGLAQAQPGARWLMKPPRAMRHTAVRRNSVMSTLSAPFTRSDAASDERTDEAVVFV